jgi:hypothetical protein
MNEQEKLLFRIAIALETIALSFQRWQPKDYDWVSAEEDPPEGLDWGDMTGEQQRYIGDRFPLGPPYCNGPDESSAAVHHRKLWKGSL